MFVLFTLLFVCFVFLLFAPRGYKPLFAVVFLGIVAMMLWIIMIPYWD